MDSWWREDFTALEEKLVVALGRKQQGRPVALPPCAFYDLNVLAFHPRQLCDEYKNPAGDGAHVYFFSPMELPSSDGDGGETTRPPRATVDGGIWKTCAGVRNVVKDPRVIIGHKTTFVLYAKGSDTRSEWGMDEFTTLGSGEADLCLRRVYRRDERWKDEQRRRQSSPWPAMREKMLLRLRARLAGAPELLEKKERELDLASKKYRGQ